MLVLGLGLRGLALAKNSRPKSWQTTKFTINFHWLEHGDWSELYFKIHVLYLLIVGNHGLVKPNTHRRRRRYETVFSRRVGVGGVYWA